MKLLQIGDRVINVEAITAASYETKDPKTLVVSFSGCDNFQVFVGDEVDIVWSFITHHARTGKQ